jgi:hypothetical protein
MQAIGSLANLVQIVVASSHAQALGARRRPQRTAISLDNRSINPISRLTATLDVPLRHHAGSSSHPSSCMYLITLYLSGSFHGPPRLQGSNR